MSMASVSHDARPDQRRSDPGHRRHNRGNPRFVGRLGWASLGAELVVQGLGQGRLARKFYLARHGDTEWTTAKRLQGQTDVPLSCEGHRQALEVAKHLTNVGFDTAYASDLSRALETARKILAGTVQPVPLVVHRGLREISDGIYEAWSIAAAAEADPRMTQRLDGQTPVLDFAPPKGESIRQVFLRQHEVASQLVRERTARRILVVGHGWELRLLVAALLDREPEWFWKLEPLCPASISVIEFHEESASIVCWNQAGHLRS